MALAAIEARVQEAYIEHSWLCHGESNDKVFLDVLRAEVLDGLSGHRAIFISGTDVVASGAVAHLQRQALACVGQGQIANGYGTGLGSAQGRRGGCKGHGVFLVEGPGEVAPSRERIPPEGLNTNGIGVMKTLVRSERCEADWFDPRGEPRCSLEDRSCQGMVLTTVSSTWPQDERDASQASFGNAHCTRAALTQRNADRDQT